MSAGKIKVIYLILYMAFAVWRSFYNIFLDDINFSGTEIGILNSVMQASFFIVVPFWGVFADKKGIRPILGWLAIASSIMVFGLNYVHVFWILLFYIPILTFFHHPLGPLTDALGTEFASTNPNYSFGKFRLWGSLGWSLASLAGGYIISYFSIKAIFPVSSILFVSLIFFLFNPLKRKKIYRPKFEPLSFKDIVTNKKLLFFIIIILIYGIVCTPVNSFLNLFFKEAGYNNVTIGIAYAVQAMSEVPLFLIGAWLVDKIGAKKIIFIAVLVMIFRLLAYGFFSNVTILLALGALQGVTLSFFLIGAVQLIQEMVPPSRHATAQSIIWTAYTGFGLSFGNIIMGILKDVGGMANAMKQFSILALVTLILTIWFFSRKN